MKLFRRGENRTTRSPIFWGCLAKVRPRSSSSAEPRTVPASPVVLWPPAAVCAPLVSDSLQRNTKVRECQSKNRCLFLYVSCVTRLKGSFEAGKLGLSSLHYAMIICFPSNIRVQLATQLDEKQVVCEDLKFSSKCIMPNSWLGRMTMTEIRAINVKTKRRNKNLRQLPVKTEPKLLLT